MNSIPNVVWPILIILYYLYTIVRKPKTVNFWVGLVCQPFWLFILNKAGFFNQLFFVHYIWILMYVVGLFAMAVLHGKELQEEYSTFGFKDILVLLFVGSLLYFGGAFQYLN